MTKKSLSDLLKEEASKADMPGEVPGPSDSSSAPPLTPGGEGDRQPIQGRRKTTSSRAKTPKGTPAKRTADQSKAQPKTPSQAAVPSSDPPATITPAAGSAEASPITTPLPETTAAAVDAALAAVQQEKANLEKIVQGLQQDLEAQQSRLFELTDRLDQVKAELEAKTQALHTTEEALAEAKATILKLSAPAEKADPRLATPRRSGGDIVPRQPLPKPASPGYVRGVPTYSPQAEQPNPMLTDADIGWVD
ncbi:MAG: hypothetical protein VKI82_06675 [Leptolyngbya sp.]|nr:hypothetical protein [Leptolyngbya sp.]